jgi:hypothetical protein
MKFKLEIDLDGAAFDVDPAPELARILAKLAKRVEAGALAEGYGATRISDINGNMIGHGGYYLSGLSRVRA